MGVDRRFVGLVLRLLHRPHNGHWMPVPKIINRALLETVGLHTYVPYLAGTLILHGLTALGIYALVRRYLGGWAAFLAGAVVLLLGAGWENIFLAIQMSHDGSTAAGTWALVLLLDERHLRRRWLAMPLRTLAVMSSAMGLFFAAAAVVIAVIAFRRRRDTPLIVAPAIVVYAIWHALYNRGAIGGDTLSMANVNAAIEYAREGVVLAIANASGHGPEVGTVLAVLLGTLLIRQVVFHAKLEPGLWAATAGLNSSFLVVGLTRNSIDEPGTSRYLYVGCIFVVIIAAAALRPGRDATHRLGFAAALGVLAGTSLLWNLGQLHAGIRGCRAGATGRARQSACSSATAAPRRCPTTAGRPAQPAEDPKPPRLRALVDRLGSPVDDAVSGPVPEPTWAMDLMLVGMADPPIAAISPVTLPVSPAPVAPGHRGTRPWH